MRYDQYRLERLAYLLTLGRIPTTQLVFEVIHDMILVSSHKGRMTTSKCQMSLTAR